ncbi:MAG: thioredoxin family protein [Planctomycetota bacterium]
MDPSDDSSPQGCGACAGLVGIALIGCGVALALKPTLWDAPPAPAPAPAAPTPVAPAEASLPRGQAVGRSQPYGARVHLKNGRALEGRVVRQTSREVVLRVAQGELVLRREQVRAIEELSERERLQVQARHERAAGRPEAAELLDQRARPAGAPSSYSGESAPEGELRALDARIAPALSEPGWPPGDVDWETDPEAAFARAQAGRRPVLAYVGSVGCPHCARLARELWRDPEVVAASRERAVFLAIHRRGTEAGSDSEGAVRLGVRAYPQLFVLDPWGQPLDLRPGATPVARTRVGRSADSLLGGLVAAAERLPPSPPRLPPLPAELPQRPELSDPLAARRARGWAALLPELSTPALVALAGWETDPVTRVRALSALAGREPVRGLGDLWLRALRDPNDYVRRAAVAAIVQREERGLLPEVRSLLEELAHGGRVAAYLQNPNNVLGDLLQALTALPDPEAEGVLIWLLRRLDARNANRARAAAALGALARRAPTPAIRAALEEALDAPCEHARSREVFLRAVLAALEPLHGADYAGPLEEALARARARR